MERLTKLLIWIVGIWGVLMGITIITGFWWRVAQIAFQ